MFLPIQNRLGIHSIINNIRDIKAKGIAELLVRKLVRFMAMPLFGKPNYKLAQILFQSTNYKRWIL